MVVLQLKWVVIVTRTQVTLYSSTPSFYRSVVGPLAYERSVPCLLHIKTNSGHAQTFQIAARVTRKPDNLRLNPQHWIKIKLDLSFCLTGPNVYVLSFMEKIFIFYHMKQLLSQFLLFHSWLSICSCRKKRPYKVMLLHLFLLCTVDTPFALTWLSNVFNLCFPSVEL